MNMSQIELISPPKIYRTSEAIETPYLRAKVEWDKRIGGVVVQAKNWRTAFLLSMAMTVVLVVALVVESQKHKVVPLVITLNTETGRPVVIGKVGEVQYQPKIQEIKYFLGQLIQKIRSVPLDPVVVRQNWLEAYNFMRESASNVLNEDAQNNPNSPLRQLGKETVIVQLLSITQVAASNSYQARWQEKRYNDQGGLLETYIMSGVFTIEISLPKTEEELIQNPLGIYLTNYQWNRELK